MASQVKAVVMAGGEGTRLRPLTVNRPKPMVPVVNRPVMEHIVGLLRQHEIKEIIATLYFMPDVIREYFHDGREFGVDLKYSVEVQPLGTAGSVRQASADLKDTFLVISGDALTDMDLTDLIRFHKAKKSVATLALTRVQNPLEFGVVITNSAGRIVRFLEKPSWSEVFSDTINTGIYVLEPEVLEMMEPDKPYDFSKDIFPKLLATGRPMYGYISRDYWCDIGSLEQSLQAQADCLAGRVRTEIPGEEVRRGIWVGRNVDIDPTVRLEAPVVIGDGAVLRRGARVGPLSVIGPNTLVDEMAEVQHGVTMAQAYVGRGAVVSAGWLSKGASLSRLATVGQGAFVGDETQIGEGAVVKPGIKIWPNKTIEAGMQVNSTIIWGARHTKAIFGPFGVSGLGNVEITPGTAVRLGEALGSTLGKGDAVCVSRDGYPASMMLKRAIMAGLAAAGIRIFNLEATPLPVVRHSIRSLGAKGGVFVMANPLSPGAVVIQLLDGRGADIDTATERKIETIMVREDTRKAPVDEIGPVMYPPKVHHYYRSDFLARLDLPTLRKRQFKIVLDYANGAAVQLMPALLGEMGCQDVAINTAVDPNRLSRTETDVSQAQDFLSGMVSAIGADLGVLFDASGQRIRLVDNRGRVLDGNQALALFASFAVERQRGVRIAVPVTATDSIEQVVSEHGVVLRTKTGARALMQAAAGHEVAFCGDEQGGYIFPEFSAGIDGLFATAQLLQMLALSGSPLDRLVDVLPRADVMAETVPCPQEAKGKVMRCLTEMTLGQEVTLIDGVKLRRGSAWVALIPDAAAPLLHLYAEPSGAAPELLREYRTVVEAAVQGGEPEFALSND